MSWPTTDGTAGELFRPAVWRSGGRLATQHFQKATNNGTLVLIRGLVDLARVKPLRLNSKRLPLVMYLSYRMVYIQQGW
jgi:hypothetical protein